MSMEHDERRGTIVRVTVAGGGGGAGAVGMPGGAGGGAAPPTTSPISFAGASDEEPDQAFCPNCGAPRVTGSRFCASCGRPFDGEAPVNRHLNWTVILSLVGAALLAIGAFLPWVSATIPLAGNFAPSGMEGGDGPVSLGLALVAATYGYKVWSGAAGPRSWIIPLILGVVGIGFYALELQSIQGRIAAIDATYRPLVTVGIGVHVILLGAIATLVAGLRQWAFESEQRNRPREDAPSPIVKVW